MHRVHSFSVLTGSAGSPLPPTGSVVTLRLLSYRGFFGWSSAGLLGGVVAGVLSPALPSSGLPGGVVAAGAQHAASAQPGHTFAKAPTRLGSKALASPASACPPLPIEPLTTHNLLGCRSVVRLPPMLPLAALVSGEALGTAGAERGARGRAGAARSLAAARKRCSGRCRRRGLQPRH